MRAAIVAGLIASSALAQETDREPAWEEWGYRPADGSTVSVTPPPLTWVHDPKAERYAVQWARRPDFADAVTVDPVRWCVYTHHEPLKPGDYHWRYRAAGGAKTSDWSRARRFTVPPDAVSFPKPTVEELRRRVPKEHPRLFLRPEDLPALRERAKGDGRAAFEALLKEADKLIGSEPTPEPAVRASIQAHEALSPWWANRQQTQKACQEAEIAALAHLLTADKRYAEAARRRIIHLAGWDPDGPTAFAVNCEAAKPMLYRLPRAYDWGYDALTPEERDKVRKVMLRRAADFWRGKEILEGNGHLNKPHHSHGNRTWHKMAECALAFLGEIPEAELWLDYAVNKFFAAYPVWADDDGGWFDGLSYWGGYMSKFAAWTEFADKAMGIDSLRKPYFARVGDYALYTAPPGSPDMGFGDLSHRTPQNYWSFLPLFARRLRNGYWAWWSSRWNIAPEHEELPLRFLWSASPSVEPKPPTDLPPSKVFHGTGVAVLNTTLLDGADNVQLRFKSSPMGRRSHGHDPHNAFTLNAYGDALLVNCVYRDSHGSPFHTRWCWNTQAQNALLVDGQGQKKPQSPEPFGRIVAADFQEGADYVAGEAAAAYEGRLKRFARHVVFVKPDVIVIADDIEAAKPASFQWMLHAPKSFEVDEAAQQLLLEREHAGLRVNFVAPEPLRLRQWTGYTPEPDKLLLASINQSADFPPQWHLEAASTTPRESVFTVTVLRPYRKGRTPAAKLTVEHSETTLAIRLAAADGSPITVALRKPGAKEAKLGDAPFTCFAVARKGDREWRFPK